MTVFFNSCFSLSRSCPCFISQPQTLRPNLSTAKLQAATQNRNRSCQKMTMKKHETDQNRSGRRLPTRQQQIYKSSLYLAEWLQTDLSRSVCRRGGGPRTSAAASSLCQSRFSLSFSWCDLLFHVTISVLLSGFPPPLFLFLPVALFVLCCVSPGACALFTLLLCRIFHLQTVSGFPCWPLIGFLFDYFLVDFPRRCVLSVRRRQSSVGREDVIEEVGGGRSKDLRLSCMRAVNTKRWLVKRNWPRLFA